MSTVAGPSMVGNGRREHGRLLIATIQMFGPDLNDVHDQIR